MTIYCEGANAAEITFSLTGGREGRIISLNPPVEVETDAKGHLQEIRSDWFISADWEGGGSVTEVYKSEGLLYIPPNILESGLKIGEYLIEFFSITNEYGGQDSYFKYYLSYYSGEIKLLYTSGVRHYWNFINAFNLPSKYLKTFKKGLMIKDKSGLLFAQEMPNSVSVNVRCISCPPGLCGVRTGYGRIACMDCKRVLNGLGEINNKLDIYGR
jgi:hypothetical protein